MFVLRVGSFPGEFAGASLKQHLAVEAGGLELTPFPGEFAGASLKLATIRVALNPAIFIPRRIRRGLIEASPGDSPSCSSTHHSPANSPGPH